MSSLPSGVFKYLSDCNPSLSSEAIDRMRQRILSGSDKDKEVRSVSSTGGQKGTKLERHDLIPAEALKQLAEHYGAGAKKYDDHNWRKGYEWSKSLAALHRHLRQFEDPTESDFDEETGSNHLVAVAWHALTLLVFYSQHKEFDDRYKLPNGVGGVGPHSST